MKAVILTLLIATAYCIPVKRSASSSESSEELVFSQQPAPMQRKAAAKLAQAEPTQTTSTESNESTDSADDTTEEADDESEADETEQDNTTNSSESESEETAATSGPPTEGPTLAPTIKTGRGDNNLVFPGDYKKSIVYVDAKEKLPFPYKSSQVPDKMGDLKVVSKKMSSYSGQNVNDVEKDNKLYKTLQLDNGLLEDGDTSTPEMEAAPGDRELDPVANQDSERASLGNSSSVSASAESEDADSISSSEETTATPGAIDSDSSQSTESQESDEDVNQTTEVLVVTAK